MAHTGFTPVRSSNGTVGILSLAGLALVTSVIGEIVISSELLRTLDSFFGLLTILLIVWHNRHIRKDIEPKVEEIKEATDRVANQLTWDGTSERRDKEEL